MEQASARVGTNHASGETGWPSLVVELVQSNIRQWELEDVTRDSGADDRQVAEAKRHIDRLNMDRHRLVEEVDTAIDALLRQHETAPLATESPGMVLDRLSVLVIRRSRTAAASLHDPSLADRLVGIETQLRALSMALDSYLDELRTGKRRFIRYESFKLYGEFELQKE